MANALIDPRRPNWTIPPSSPESLRAGSNLPAVNTRPNFTIPGNEPPTATAVKPTSPARSVLGAVKAAALPAADTLAAGAGGAALAAGVNSIRQGALNTAAPMAPLPDAPGQIPVDTRFQAPAAAAGSLLNQSEAGRNIGNAVNALPGLRMPAGALMRTAAATNTMKFAGPAAMAGATGKGYVAGDAAFPGVAPERAPVVAPSIRQPFSDARNGTYDAPDNPRDLTGKIVKSTDANGNAVYTGSNIKAGADIVDRDGKLLNTDDPNNPLSLRTTGVSVAGPGGGGRSPSEIYANTSRINGQISEIARALDAYGPGGGGGINGNGIFDSLRATQSAGRPATRAERVAMAELASREQMAAAQNAATLRGQEMSASTSRANTRDTVSATLRGQDMDYAEKLDSKRLDLAAREAQRRAISAAWQGTTDPQVVAARLASFGYDPSTALAVAGGQRAAAEAGDKNFRNITEAAGATVDKSGQPVLNPALQAVAQNVIANAMPGVRNASPADQNARLRDVQAVGNLAVGLQQAQGGSLLQSIGIDNAPPAVSTLPNLQGATLRERTLGDTVMSPFANASRGDYVVVQPDGTEVSIKRSKVGERELDYLKQQGVTLRN